MQRMGVSLWWLLPSWGLGSWGAGSADCGLWAQLLLGIWDLYTTRREPVTPHWQFFSFKNRKIITFTILCCFLQHNNLNSHSMGSHMDLPPPSHPTPLSCQSAGWTPCCTAASPANWFLHRLMPASQCHALSLSPSSPLTVTLCAYLQKGPSVPVLGSISCINI